jgi:phage terminase Nu1 subunit (DNA packaging protein)
VRLCLLSCWRFWIDSGESLWRLILIGWGIYRYLILGVGWVAVAAVAMPMKKVLPARSRYGSVTRRVSLVSGNFSGVSGRFNWEKKMIENNSVSVNFLADLLLMTDRHVQRLSNDGIVKKSSRGEYLLIESVRGYIRYLNNQIPNKATSDGGATVARVDAEVERAKYLKHKAELTRMEEEEKKGLLVSLDSQRHESYRIGRILQTNILNIPARISQDLAIETDHVVIHRKLETELRQAMQEIADIISAGGDVFTLPLDAEADCAHWLVVSDAA